MNDVADTAAPGGSSSIETLQRAIDARDWATATSAVRDGWFDLAADHAATTLAQLERIPASVLRSEPLLSMELGLLLNQTRFQRFRALRCFITAVRAARSSKNDELNPIDRLMIRSSESAAFRLLGRTDLAVAAARAAMEQAQSLSDDQRAAVSELPRIYATLGISFFYAGLIPEALRAGALGLAEAPTTAPSSGLGALALLCGVHAIRGDLRNVQEHLEYARNGPWTDRQRNGYSGTFYRIAEATVALERFDPATARNELDRLAASGRHSNEHWAILARTQAMIELVDGHPARGMAVLDEVIALRGMENGARQARAHIAPVRSLLALALGHPDGASAILAHDLPTGPAASIGRARIALALGKTGTALNELRAVSGEHLPTRLRAEAAAIDLAALLRISATPRQPGVVQRLGSLLERTDQRLAIALLPPQDFVRVVDALAATGFEHVTDGIPATSLLVDVEPEELLSKRERAVLEQLMRTGSVSEIAAALVVSGNTIKSQVRSIYRKLGVSSREDAIAVAIERHLVGHSST